MLKSAQKRIKNSFYYINRVIISHIVVLLIALYCIATLLLNLINLI